LCKIADALRPASQARNVAEYIVSTKWCRKRNPLVSRLIKYVDYHYRDAAV
jgi:hypothetical protein